ncbi:MAG: PilZ domain-containing protein [Proteobacteria bacterium]|nr:PilZ domain-containing protein [Pseudomonadota bacterium]
MTPESTERAKSDLASREDAGNEDAGNEDAGNEDTGNEDASNAAVTASIVAEHGGGEAAYSMFEVRNISTGGAFFAGSLFLELHEEFTVELSLRDVSLRARARVVALEYGDIPGMAVEFLQLSDGDRALIEAWTSAATRG